MTHTGEYCSFDAFVGKYRLAEPALLLLARIVRGADTSRLDLTPESAGLYAVSLGLSDQFLNHHEMLKHGIVVMTRFTHGACIARTNRMAGLRLRE